MTDEEKKAAEEAAAKAADDALNAKLNTVVSSHMKRLEEKFSKSLAEQLAKFAPPKPEDKPADKGDGEGKRADPEVVKLREQLEKITKSQADAETRAKAAEDKARRDTAHAALREQLEAKGIKGARARAVIADLETSQSLRYNEESGAYELVVKRARTKGARAEEVAYDDFSAGVDDWSKTTDAAEFLPPPSSVQRTGARPGQTLTQRAAGVRPAGTNGTNGTNGLSPRASADAAAREITSQGISEADVFGD